MYLAIDSFKKIGTKSMIAVLVRAKFLALKQYKRSEREKKETRRDANRERKLN